VGFLQISNAAMLWRGLSKEISLQVSHIWPIVGYLQISNAAAYQY
jgi:hypothetical protein